MINNQIKNKNIEIRIINVVSSTKLNSTLNIEKLGQKLPNCVYEPEMFSGLVYRMTDPKATIIMFASGKISSIGTSSETLSLKSLNNVFFEIGQIIKKKVIPTKIHIENIVGITDIGGKIDLDRFSMQFSDVVYNPKRFPGAVFTFKKDIPKIKLLVFSSGKMISVGAKEEEITRQSLHKTFKKLIQTKCIMYPRI